MNNVNANKIKEKTQREREREKGLAMENQEKTGESFFPLRGAIEQLTSPSSELER